MAEIRRTDEIAEPLYSPGIVFSDPDATRSPGFNLHALSERPSVSGLFTVENEPVRDEHIHRLMCGEVPERKTDYAEVVPSVRSHYAPLKRIASKLLVAANMGLGLLAGPAAVLAQERGTLSMLWCDGEKGPHYAKLTVTRQDSNDAPIIERVFGAHRFNITNLIAGEVYEVKIQNCTTNKAGDEDCSGYSQNMPLGVPSLFGNSDSRSTPGTILRVDARDALRCWNVYTGMDSNPSHAQACDFNGNWKVDADDIAFVFFGGAAGNYGKLQFSPFFGQEIIDPWDTNFVKCNPNRCPEKEDCGDVPYGPLEEEFTLAQQFSPEINKFMGQMARMNVKSPYELGFPTLKLPASYPTGTIFYANGFLKNMDAGKVQENLARQSNAFKSYGTAGPHAP
jgi:hypothetical protein